MGMPRLAIAPIVVLAAAEASAQANCDLSENEVLRNREKRCTAAVIKVSCDGAPVDIVSSGRTCCPAPENRVIEWRCGGEPEPELFCPAGATALLVNPTIDGARFRCLSRIASDEEPPPAGTGDAAPPDDPPPLPHSDQNGS